MIGFDQADIRRIKAEETRNRGMAVLEEIENGTDNTSAVEEVYIETSTNQ